ncbi:hypothetical protein A33M_4319 [Rhodovulum sp. PH10]|nr:hypothetical protein A33M_4319 [Rhodovulum sp. PH10]
MIDTWLGLPAAALLASLVGLFAGGAAVMAWLALRSPVRERVRSLTGITESVFASAAVLFSLLAGFLASDIADRNHRAWRAVNAEAGAIASLFALGRSSGAPEIDRPLKAYAEAVASDEWREMARHRHSPQAEAALHALMRQASDPGLAAKIPPPVHAAILSAVLRLGEARADRLAVALDRTARIQWLSVLVLGLVTQLTITLVHLEYPRAHIAAAAVFALAVIVALWPIALQETPFSGTLGITAEAFRREAARIAPGE